MDVNKELFLGSDDFYIEHPWDKEQLKRLPARTLAYIGDSVYELALRLRHIRTGVDDTGKLHDSLVKTVSSVAQSRIFLKIIDRATEEEQQLLKSWRNAKQPQKCGAGTRGEYARATALEAWVAYLFLTRDSERLQQVFKLVEEDTPYEKEPAS